MKTMTEPLNDRTPSATVSFSRRNILAEFLVCLFLIAGFGAGSLYLLHREQAANATIAEAALRSGQLDQAVREHQVRSERDLRIVFAATTLLSLALFVALYWRMDRLFEMFARAQDEAHHQAHHDPLTGLPNARLLSDRLAMALAHARRVRQTVAVVALDLDGFRQLNADHGPNVGDEVLRQAAARLQRLSRDEDTVARTRDDEFFMVLSDIKSQSHAAAFAERLIGNLSGAYTVDERDLTLGAHVGVALYTGQATSADDLVRTASAALWKAKNRAEGRIELSVKAGPGPRPERESGPSLAQSLRL
jgi:diguanylate cyclase (GGDEF)-like protein